VSSGGPRPGRDPAGAAPTLASGANIAAFTVGNAVGAWLGGVVIAAGLGFTGPLWVGATLAAGALAVLVLAELLAGRQSSVSIPSSRSATAACSTANG
jgi:DHA1 family inner membrane transport protein